MMGIHMLLAFCVIPPSPAGGSYLDLSSDAFYFAKDNPTLDKLLGDEWTIEMWFYIERFPSLPLRPFPKRNFSLILIKPGNYAIYLYSSRIEAETGPSIHEALRAGAFFIKYKEMNLATGVGDTVAFNIPEDLLRKGFRGITTKRWYHLAFQQKGRVVSAYINGVKEWDRRPIDPNLPHPKLDDLPTPLYIGHLPSAGRFKNLFLEIMFGEKVESFKGAIDELRISNVARYGDGFVPPKRLEVDRYTMALWHFDEPLGSLSYEDASGNGNTLLSSRLLSVSLKADKASLWGRLKRGELDF